MIDTTPRPDDPLHVLTPGGKSDSSGRRPTEIQARNGAEGSKEVQLATPVRQLEGTRGRGQAFDTAMGPQQPRRRLPATDANLVVQTLPAPTLNVDLMVSAQGDPPPDLTLLNAANRQQGLQGYGEPAASAEAVPLPISSQAAMDLASASPELAIGRAANTTDARASSESAVAGEGDANDARYALVAAVMAMPDADATASVALLDGDWTRNSVALVAAALAGRQLIGGSPAGEPLADPRVARWKLRWRKGAGTGGVRADTQPE
jgi:hypothetical protein